MKKLLLIPCLLQSLVSIAQWNSQNSGTSNFLTGLFFPTIDTGYAADGGGLLLKTVNGGQTWTLPQGQVMAQSLFFLTKDIGFAAGTGIMKTTDGANSWMDVQADSVWGMWGIDFPSPTIGYAVGGNLAGDSVVIYKTIDGGNNWLRVFQKQTYAAFQAINFTDNNTGYLTDDGDIYKTVNGGLNWSLQFSTMTSDGFTSIFFPVQDTGYAVGTGGIIYATNNGGSSWNQQTNPNTNPLYSVYFTSSNRGFAVGGNGFNSGTILQTSNGGINWTLSTITTTTFNCVHFPSAGVGYACGTNGDIQKYNGNIGFGEWNNGDVILSVSPNPSNGRFTLTCRADKKYSVTLTDLAGRTVLDPVEFEKSVSLDASTLPGGCYLATVLSPGGEISVKRIILQ